MEAIVPGWAGAQLHSATQAMLSRRCWLDPSMNTGAVGGALGSG